MTKTPGGAQVEALRVKPSAIDIDTLIPHRRPMRLIDEVLEVGDTTAVTASVVNESWPLVQGPGASPVVLIELAAQTAGVCIGHREKAGAEGDPQGMGFLVGIKTAEFFTESLEVGARVTVRTVNRFSFDLFTEIEATAFVEETKVGHIVLQVVQSDATGESSAADMTNRPELKSK